MGVKNDISAVRTPADLERKYALNKRFSQVLGILDDTQKNIVKTQTELRNEITAQATAIRRDTTKIILEANQRVENLSAGVEGIRGDVAELEKSVEAKVSADEVAITVRQELGNGVDKVVTQTGYTFGNDGMNISKSGEEMNNTLDHTGMYVKRNGQDILKATNAGVEGLNVHVKTFLKIGAGDGRSRIEDYREDRTGCFWIGG